MAKLFEDDELYFEEYKNLPEGTPIPDRSMQHLKGGNRKEKSSPCTNG